MRSACAAISLLLLTAAGMTQAGEWATLKGRIVYDGEPPVPKRVTVDKDVEVCGKYDLFDESLIVNPKNHGIKDVVIRLSLGRGKTTEVHPSYAESMRAEVLLDNKCCRLEPHVTVMRTTQTLVVHNSDPKGDSIKIDPRKNTAINITMPPGTRHVQQFPRAESMPVRVSCSIHPWELGWLVIEDHPYVAVTDADGRFEIKNVPAGDRSFMFWQEKSGYLAEVVFQDRQETWRRGTRQFSLKPGVNDLGEMIVKPSLFEH